MAGLITRLNRLLNLPFQDLVRVLAFRAQATTGAVIRKYISCFRPSYEVANAKQGQLRRIIAGLPAVSMSKEEKTLLFSLARRYLEHRFDLLGSGWIAVNLQGDACMVNRANLREAQAVWAMIEGDYHPIDWQLDIKSGYRWNEAIWYKDIQWGCIEGADIKVPWELARMQHLALFAWVFAAACTEVPEEAELRAQCCQEFRNQIIDFIANNPPGFGVNWNCTMEVALRAVNWLVSFDLFRAYGAQFDESFSAILQRAIYEHARHCINNLEYSVTCRNNHYLANIAGLLVMSTYLPPDADTGRWLIFARKEMIKEVQLQFNKDGTNFEASTCYHRLSSEMVLYAALLSGCHAFPSWFWSGMEKAVQFTMDIQKPNGEVPQIGDNDNGRFLKIWPCVDFTEGEPKERTLDHRHLLLTAGIVLNRADFISKAGDLSPEAIVVQALSDNFQAPSSYIEKSPARTDGIGGGLDGYIWQAWRYGNLIQHRFTAEKENLLDGLELLQYPDFGLYIYKSNNLYLAIRCGDLNGQKLGHAHNDQLSVELTIEGKDLVRDPGTYVYSAWPSERNRYRSTSAHFTPQRREQEQNSWKEGIAGLFSLEHRSYARCLCFTPEGFAGEHQGFDRPVVRVVRLFPKEIEILDFGGDSAAVAALPFSDGYGRSAKGG